MKKGSASILGNGVLIPEEDLAAQELKKGHGERKKREIIRSRKGEKERFAPKAERLTGFPP